MRNLLILFAIVNVFFVIALAFSANLDTKRERESMDSVVSILHSHQEHLGAHGKHLDATDKHLEALRHEVQELKAIIGRYDYTVLSKPREVQP